MRKTPKPIGEEEAKQIVERFQSGELRQQIAHDLNRDCSVITKVLKRQGIEPPAKRGGSLSGTQEEEIVDAYLNDKTIKSIAKRYGISPQTVAKIVSRHGIPDRAKAKGYLGLSEHDRQSITSLWRDGSPQQALSRAYNINPATIRRVLLEGGVTQNELEERWGGQFSTERSRSHTHEGYVRLRLPLGDPLRPMADGEGYILEHRLVMAESLGRLLLPTETVHHKDGNRTNNDIDNLELRTGAHGKGQIMQCADCGSHNIVGAPIGSLTLTQT